MVSEFSSSIVRKPPKGAMTLARTDSGARRRRRPLAEVGLNAFSILYLLHVLRAKTDQSSGHQLPLPLYSPTSSHTKAPAALSAPPVRPLNTPSTPAFVESFSAANLRLQAGGIHVRWQVLSVVVVLGICVLGRQCGGECLEVRGELQLCNFC